MQKNRITARETHDQSHGQPAVSVAEVATGPSWQKARGGSGRGRFRGLADSIFVVFLPPWLPPGFHPAFSKRPGHKTIVFSSDNRVCKIPFREESRALALHEMNEARRNTKLTTICQKDLRNPSCAVGAPFGAALKRLN